MKLFVKLMICLTVLALAGPFFLTGPDGKPLMSLSSLGLGDIPYKLKSLFANASTKPLLAPAQTQPAPQTPQHPEGLTLVAGDQVFYRWQDEHGIWQFSTEPPPENATNTAPVITNPNANIIQSLKKDDINAALGITTEEETSTSTSSDFVSAQDKTSALSEELESLGYDPTNPMKQVPKILEQTKQIKSTMEAQQRVLDQL